VGVYRIPKGVHRPGDAVEPGIEDGDHRRGLRRLGQGGEVAQIGTEQRGADGLPDAARRLTLNLDRVRR
jgi:hypothetical protein